MKIIGRIVWVVFALVGAFATVIVALSYFENPSSTFRTYEELEASGLIDRGWISPYLPRSATDIEESHDLDTNRGWASFKYKPGDLMVPRKFCQLLHESKDGAKYLCPPYERTTSILVLKADGSGELTTHADDI